VKTSNSVNAMKGNYGFSNDTVLMTFTNSSLFIPAKNQYFNWDDVTNLKIRNKSKNQLGQLIGFGAGVLASTMVYNSLKNSTGEEGIAVLSMVFAVPTGILAAVFLSDIVSFRVQNIVKPVIELLAAIPSVAYGFFAVMVLAPWMQNKAGFNTGVNALNAGIVLAVMALPTIVSVAQDSISAVGRELREASYGLGATRMETIFKVVIPAAHSGIIAAIILGMMRAVGETMVVWMASGNASQIPHPWWDLSQSIRTMTATIAGDMGETAKGSDHYRSLFTIGLFLLIMTLCLNLFSEYFLTQAAKKSLVYGPGAID